MNMQDDTNTRNLKDFLELYNKLTEQCFMNCVSNFNQRKISADEMRCVNFCTDRYVSFNQRLMRVFMEQQTQKQQNMIKEAEKAAGGGLQGGITPVNEAEKAAGSGLQGGITPLKEAEKAAGSGLQGGITPVTPSPPGSPS